MGERVFTESRRAQGFRDQRHLDAFYAYYDHVRFCGECGPGEAMPVDDGMQPTRRDCPVALGLFAASA